MALTLSAVFSLNQSGASTSTSLPIERISCWKSKVGRRRRAKMLKTPRRYAATLSHLVFYESYSDWGAWMTSNTEGCL